MDGVLFIFLKHAVKPEGIHHPLPCDAYNQASLLRPLNLAGADQMPQEYFIVLLRDPVKIVQT